jgi:hypothetical protein
MKMFLEDTGEVLDLALNVLLSSPQALQSNTSTNPASSQVLIGAPGVRQNNSKHCCFLCSVSPEVSRGLSP